MKINKKLFFSILGILIFIPFSVFSAVIYERTPSDYTIESPVNISVSIDDFYVVCSRRPNWQIEIYNTNWETAFWSEIFTSTTLSASVDFDLPVDSYIYVDICCFLEGEDCGDSDYDYTLEYNNDNPIFEIIEPVSPFALPINSVNSTIAYIGDLFTSIGGFIWLIIGIPLGFIVIKRVIALMPK